MFVTASLGALLLLASPGEPGEAAERASEVLSESRFQTSFPGEEPAGFRERRERSSSGERGAAPEAAPAPAPTGGRSLFGAVMQALVWGLLIVGALAVVVLLAQEVGDRVQKSRFVKKDDGEDAAPEAVGAGPALADAEAAARGGRFSEAVHLLLLHALQALREGEAEGLAPALTGREILRRIDLQPGRSEALRELVGAVERFHFGGRAASEDDYRASRRAFELAVPAVES